MSSSDSDSGVLRRKSIWGPKSLQGGLYKRSHIPLNLTKPVEKKQKKKKKAYWGESSSDEDYASSSSHGGGDSGTSTPDYGSKTPDDSGSDSDQEQKYNGKNVRIEDEDDGYESPAPSSTMFGKAFSAAGSFLSSLPASAQKLRQRALGSAQKAIAPAVAQATMAKKVDEITESWKTASEFAKVNLAAQMRKPVESDPFSAQPIGAGAAGSSDTSHSSASNQLASVPRPKSLKPLDPVEEAVKEKNLASERKLADLAADEKAIKALKARRDQALQEAQKALTVAQGTKATSSHARVTDVFSAAAKAGSHADQIADLDTALARVQEQQKDEKRKIEARELDPSIQTEAETDAESRSAAAAAPRPTSIIERWQATIKDSEPYQKAESFINNMPIDAALKMMTASEYMDMMNPYVKGFADFLKNEATKFKGSNPRSSIAIAEGYWQNLMEHGWKNYQFKYAKESRILARAHELEQRYFDERKANREERKKEREARNQSKRLKDLEQQAALGMKRVREQESGSDAETLSEPESGSDAEPDFVKEAEEEVVEEEVQEKLSMKPDVPTITYRTLSHFPIALDLATYSQTMSKEFKLNPANAILILKRFDEILAADSQKLAKKGLIRMPGFSIQGTGKIVKTGKKSSYASMKAVIVKRISELEKKQQAGRKVSSSSSSSSSSRSSGRAK